MDGLVNVEYSDNLFEAMGIEMQMNANSFAAAKHNYEVSCAMCCMRGCGAIQCAHCGIREAMLSNAKIFRKKLTKNDKEWVEKERELQ